MSAKASSTRHIRIRISGSDGRYDFTYEPSTVNVKAGEEIEFMLEAGGPVNKVWIAFDLPVDGKNFFANDVFRSAFSGLPPNSAADEDPDGSAQAANVSGQKRGNRKP